MSIPAFLCVIFAITTISRNDDWVSNYSLFSADVRKAPNSAKLNYNLGVELLKNTDNDNSSVAKEEIQQRRITAIKYLCTAVDIYPDYEQAHRVLCDVYFRMGRYDSAEAHGQKAFNLDPNIVTTLNNLGGICFQKKDYAKTISYCRSTIQLDASTALPYANIGLCYFMQKRFDSAIYYSQKAIAIDPNLRQPHETLSQIYKIVGESNLK